jgi:hypothetical protein
MWEVGSRRRFRSGVASRSWLGEVERDTISIRVVYLFQAAIIGALFLGSKVKDLWMSTGGKEGNAGADAVPSIDRLLHQGYRSGQQI